MTDLVRLTVESFYFFAERHDWVIGVEADRTSSLCLRLRRLSDLTHGGSV